MRAILESVARPERRLRLGMVLAEISRKLELTNADVDGLEHASDTRPAQPFRIE